MFEMFLLLKSNVIRNLGEKLYAARNNVWIYTLFLIISAESAKIVTNSTIISGSLLRRCQFKKDTCDFFFLLNIQMPVHLSSKIEGEKCILIFVNWDANNDKETINSGSVVCALR